MHFRHYLELCAFCDACTSAGGNTNIGSGNRVVSSETRVPVDLSGRGLLGSAWSVVAFIQSNRERDALHLISSMSQPPDSSPHGLPLDHRLSGKTRLPFGFYPAA